MKVALFIAIVIYSVSAVISPDPPTNIFVWESSACMSSTIFNTAQISAMIARPGYDAVANVEIFPTANLVCAMQANGSCIYTHRNGEYALRKAFAQLCVRRLYTNDKALRWAASVNDIFTTKTLDNLTTRIRTSPLFSADSGAAVVTCMNAAPGTNNLVNGHYLAQSANIQINAYTLLVSLPQIYNKTTPRVIAFSTTGFFASVCRSRSDRTLLSACTGLSSQMEFNDAPSDAEEEKTNSNFDYAKFWSTPDDEESDLKFLS